MSGGDFTDPRLALNSITNASASNPYLVKIMPGVYEWTGTYQVYDYTDVEGSGPDVTQIHVTGSGYMYGAIQMEAFNSKTEMRDLSLVMESTPGGRFDPFHVFGTPTIRNVKVRTVGAYSNLVYGNPGANPTFIDTELVADAGGTGALISDNSTFTFINSSISLSGEGGTGIWLNYATASVIARDTTIDVPGYGVYAPFGSAINGEFYNGRIKGSQYALSIGPGGQFRAVGTQVVGLIQNEGSIKLLNCFDQEFDPITFP